MADDKPTISFKIPDGFWQKCMTPSERKKAIIRGRLWPRHARLLIEYINAHPEEYQEWLASDG